MQEISKLPDSQHLSGPVKVDVGVRVPEDNEIFPPDEAKTYLECDFPETSDYAIVAAEINLEFGNGGRIDGHIVEVCPGPGNLCDELLDVGADKVTGIDASPVMVDHAGNKFRREIAEGRIEFRLGMAQNLPLADDSVDGIVNFNSFHQFATDERAFAALQEMVRVIKLGGWALVRDFKRGASQEALDKRLETTLPHIKPLLLASIEASFTDKEFINFLNQIPGINFDVHDTQNPWRLPEAVCERMRNDPVEHWRDFFISQHVIIRKLK